MVCMQDQVHDLIRIIKLKMNWPAAREPDDDQRMMAGLENTLVMEHKLCKMIVSQRDEIFQELDERMMDMIRSFREDISRISSW